MVFVASPRRTILMSCCMLLFLAAGSSAAENPWADTVISYNAIDPVPGFEHPENILGEPVGGSVYAVNNSKTHSVGTPGAAPGSYVLVKFNTPVEDHPDNLLGYDFIVYSNSFWAGGNPYRKWVEPALIEISEDINANGLPDDPWYVIPGSRGLNAGVLPQGISNPIPPLAGNVLNPNTDGTEYDWGYAELTPTVQKYLDNFMRPDNPHAVGLTQGSGGGDAFDIAWAVPEDGTGNPDGISRFHFLRVSAFVSMVDSVLGDVSPEISGVSTVARNLDADGDGILDDYETRVAGTDPARPESTVLALEIPQEYGGSPAGAFLGEAVDAQGNALALFSRGTRTGARNYNCIVNIDAAADPAPAVEVPGLLKSGAVRAFICSEADLQAAQVQDGQFSVTYAPAEITGLDEAGLQPYRYDGAQFTQAGLTSVTRDLQNNRVSFNSRYTGVFVLASVPGDGDIDGTVGAVRLHAVPAAGVVGEPGTVATFTSDMIYVTGENPVPDGTHFTVSTTLGDIATPDLEAALEGVQVAATGGVLSFRATGGTVAGIARVTAISLDGLLHGGIDYVFAPGPATGPVDIYPVRPGQTAPGPVTFITSQISDAFGNVLNEDQVVTLAVEGGTPAGKDARPDLPGHQVPLASGSATFSVRVETDNKYDTAAVFVYLYADPEETELIGSASFVLEAVPVPVRCVVLAALLIAVSAVYLLRQRPPRSRRAS